MKVLVPLPRLVELIHRSKKWSSFGKCSFALDPRPKLRQKIEMVGSASIYGLEPIVQTQSSASPYLIQRNGSPFDCSVEWRAVGG